MINIAVHSDSSLAFITGDADYESLCQSLHRIKHTDIETVSGINDRKLPNVAPTPVTGYVTIYRGIFQYMFNYTISCLSSSCPTSCTQRTREKNVINLVGGKKCETKPPTFHL